VVEIWIERESTWPRPRLGSFHFGVCVRRQPERIIARRCTNHSLSIMLPSASMPKPQGPSPKRSQPHHPNLKSLNKLIARNACHQGPKSRTSTSTLSTSCPMSTTLNFEAQIPSPEYEIPQTRNLERAGPMEAVARFKMRLDSALRLDDARRAGKEVSMSLRLSMVKFTPLPPLGIHEQNTRWQP